MSSLSSTARQSSTPDLRETATCGRVRGMWRLLHGYRLAYLGAALSLGVATAARTSSLLLIRYFVDDYLNPDAASVALWIIVFGFLVLALVQGGFTFFSGALAAHTAEGITQRLRDFLLDHIQHLPFSYHDEVQTGELVQRVTSDVDALRRFFAVQAIRQAASSFCS